MKLHVQHLLLTDLVAILDMGEVGGLSKARGLVEVSQIWPDIGVVSDTLLVALKNKIFFFYFFRMQQDLVAIVVITPQCILLCVATTNVGAELFAKPSNFPVIRKSFFTLNVPT